MKLKAVVAKTCPARLQEALESARFRQKVLEQVLVKHLRVGIFGPAEFYIQACDEAVGNPDQMCEARLTGVSVNTRRATDDFRDALVALEALYKKEIETNLPKGTKCQLFVSLMLDRAPLGEDSSLMERDPIWVIGTAD